MGTSDSEEKSVVPGTHVRVRPAIFLDRDGTLIEEAHYLSDPAGVRLLPGAVAALRWFRDAGFVCVVVTNQSGIGRGLFSEDRMHEIHAEMERQLAEEGAAVDAIYHCPYAPASDDPAVIGHPDRKPAPGMLRRAAHDLNLELGRSWMIGDKLSDVLTGINAGCRGSILVQTGQGRAAEAESRGIACAVAADLLAAAHLIGELEACGGPKSPLPV